MSEGGLGRKENPCHLRSSDVPKSSAASSKIGIEVKIQGFGGVVEVVFING